MKSIYELDLHEEIDICNGTHIMRVPGGWRYLDINSAPGSQSSIFVSYNDEFHPDQLKPERVGFSSRTENKELR